MSCLCRFRYSIQVIAAAITLVSTAACSLIESTPPDTGAPVRRVEIAFARKLAEPLAVLDTVTVTAIVRDARGNSIEDAEVWWSLSVDGRALGDKIGTVKQTGPRTALLTLVVDRATLKATTTLEGSVESVTGVLEVATGRRSWHAFIWTRENGFSSVISPGNVDVVPNAINDRGEIVGSVRFHGTSRETAFVWSAATGFTYLDSADSAISIAKAINQSGTVTGWTHANGARGRAFIWKRETGMTIVTPEWANDFSEGTTINSQGEVAGFAITDVAFKAFRWSSPAPTKPLPVNADYPHSYVVSINDAGDVLGYDGVWEGWDPVLARQTPILWTAKGDRVDIANCQRQCWMRVAALNNRGQIAGTLEQTAFRRSANGEMTSIPITDHTFSIAMNDLGDIVGRAWRGTAGREWLWTASGEVIEIGLPPGARAAYVIGINNKGQVVGEFL